MANSSENQNPKKENGKKKKSGQPNEFLKYTGMATQMAVVILIGVFLGRWLDESREFPIYTLVFSMLAVGVAIYIVIRDTSR